MKRAKLKSPSDYPQMAFRVSTEEKAKKQSKVAEFAESSVEITTKPRAGASTD